MSIGSLPARLWGVQSCAECWRRSMLSSSGEVRPDYILPLRFLIRAFRAARLTWRLTDVKDMSDT